MFGKLLKEKIEELNQINGKISATKAELSNLESEKAELCLIFITFDFPSGSDGKESAAMQENQV